MLHSRRGIDTSASAVLLNHTFRALALTPGADVHVVAAITSKVAQPDASLQVRREIARLPRLVVFAGRVDVAGSAGVVVPGRFVRGHRHEVKPAVSRQRGDRRALAVGQVIELGDTVRPAVEAVEGLNSLVQAAKRRARGYHSTRNYIAMIYLTVGKLDIVTHTE